MCTSWKPRDSNALLAALSEEHASALVKRGECGRPASEPCYSEERKKTARTASLSVKGSGVDDEVMIAA